MLIVNAMSKCISATALLIFATALSCTIGCGGGPPGLPESQQAIYDEIKQYEGVSSFNPEVGIFEIDLSNSKINDAFIAKLAEIPDLNRLVLNNTPITDACVPSLKKMKKLTSLEVASSKTIVKSEYQDAGDGNKLKVDTLVPVPLLSPAAVQSLRAALPDLTILGIEETETPPDNAT